MPDSEHDHFLLFPHDVVEHVFASGPLPNRASLVQRSTETRLLGERTDTSEQSASDSIGRRRIFPSDEPVQPFEIGEGAPAVAQPHLSSIRGTGFSASVPHDAIHSRTTSPSTVGAPASISSSASRVWR